MPTYVLTFDQIVFLFIVLISLVSVYCNLCLLYFRINMYFEMFTHRNGWRRWFKQSNRKGSRLYNENSGGRKGVPSVSRTALRVPTIENNLAATAEHVQQAIRENCPDLFWNTPNKLLPRIPSPSSGQVKFRQDL